MSRGPAPGAPSTQRARNDRSAMGLRHPGKGADHVRPLAPALPSGLGSMTPHPAVLIGLEEHALRDRLAGWVRRLGYDACATADGNHALASVRAGGFVASFLDARLGAPEGDAVWRVVRPIVGHRLVLMARERSNDLWL